MSTSNVTSSFSGFRIGMSAAIAVRALVSRSMLASNGGFSDITCGAAARVQCQQPQPRHSDDDSCLGSARGGADGVSD